ncbi:PAS domain S-box protein (plasmid) [Haloferax mediterranei ATCC 33500]|uniref:Bacterio-opsin activator-like protein n=1 Tax=Haloferax mediterranei (strain ATCC 33500 / DSM 1411 / JCM 8866 / NBRC 14739 / NCIMB 2177 / R-4) TaxID=523841 RepID=I3RBG2_HALMT|nr:bacterio-opsin activator-like protein [Haloferax mediterranei ATCC 33500]AHZ24379.1 transcriptional regulator [Haloferax mediterranei ATCC 33500]ELZ97118.1 bacterio-opsin activator-like protein [Haloferax mediterranei ATCC 33500]QCQ77080.1 PAS domain S-box protein [Haloferax mediterranei ATCC 33500]
MIIDPGEGIISIDQGGTVVFANPPVERLLGHDPDTLVGKSIVRFFPTDHDTPLETIQRAATPPERPHRAVTDSSLVHAEGHEVPVSFTVDATDYEQSRFFTLRIHERTRHGEPSQSRANVGESLLRKIFEESNDAMVVFDNEHDEMVACNPRACELFGYNRDDLLSTAPSELYSYDTTTFDRFVDEVLEAGTACSDALEHRTADGSTLSVEISASRIEFEGDPHVLACVRDISGRVQRKQKLERYRTMVEAVGEGVYAADENLRFTLVNDGACELTNYDREELIGRPLTDLLAGEADDVDPADYEDLLVNTSSSSEPLRVVDAESAREARKQLYQSDQDVMTAEAPIRTKNGNVIPLEIRFSELPAGPDAEFRGTTGVLIDISDRKEHKRQLKTLNKASRELPQAEDPQAIAKAALDAVEQVVGFDVSGVRMFDEETNTLTPIEMTDAAEQLIDSRPAFELGATLAGHAYRRGEAVRNDEIDGSETVVGETSGETSFHFPLGEHGTLTVFVPSGTEVSESDIQLLEVLSATVTAHLNRAEREHTIQEQKHECRNQRDQLDTLNRINILIQDVVRELVKAGTRDGIENQVCRQLAESNLYRSAWIAEVNGVTDGILIKTGAGVEDGYLDAIEQMKLPRIGNGTVKQAIETGELSIARLYQVNSNTSTPEVEPPSEGEVEVTAAIPLRYGNRIYGVLVVDAAREDAFGEHAQSGLKVLGDAIGFSINALRNRELLQSDEIVELEFELTDQSNLPVYFSEKLGCRCRLEGTAPAEDGNYLCYLWADEASADTVSEVAEDMETVTHSRVIKEQEEECLFEVIKTESVLQTMAEVGATVQNAVAEDGDGTLVIETSQTTNLQEVIEALQSLYPTVEITAKRTVDRSVQTVTDLRNTAEDRLTEKQRQAIKAAYHAGYYDWPRGSTAEEIAESMDVSSATLHQHLRRATWKLLTTFLEETHDHPG